MSVRYWGNGLWILMLTMSAASAQDHRHYEYYVDVDNGLNESVAVSCNGKHPVTLRPGESRSMNLHGGESLHVHCNARDHHGQPLWRQEFELDHHDNRAAWPLGQGQDDDHDHDHEDDN